MEESWNPMDVAEVADRFADAGVAWWIAGGRAIDLFLGWETRPHADLDVEMFRQDRSVLFDIFAGWDIHAVSEARREPWTDPEGLDDAAYGVWLRPDATCPWVLEIMFADEDGSEWRFRPDPSVTMPFNQLVLRTPNGTPFCVPEVQLLFKSLRARSKDDVDLARCLPRMDGDQQGWLAAAVETTTPHHPWVAVLAASLDQQHE